MISDLISESTTSEKFFYVRFLYRLLAAFLLIAPLVSQAAVVQLAWDAVDDDRVGLYQVWYGTIAGTYQDHVNSSNNTTTISGLDRDTNYFFAVRACTADASRCSAYSNELEHIEVNRVPAAANDSATVSEDSGANVINVLANDIDPDGDALSVSDADTNKGSVTVNSDGALLYTPPANFFGSNTISYTISDGYGGSDTASVSVTVTGINDLPTATNDSATIAEDSGSNTISVLANDSDMDGDDLSVTDARANRGAVSVSANNSLRYSPPANFVGSDTISYTISDGNGGNDTASVSVNVTGINDSPIAADDSATVAEDSENSSINVLANDNDIDGDTLTVSDASAITGTVSISGNGILRYSPPENYFGGDTISYTINDGNGGSDTASVSVSVTGVNDSPEAANDSATVVEGSTSNIISVLANDTDVDGDTLTVTEASASNGTVSLNSDGTLSYSPETSLVGSDTIDYLVSDGNGGSATASVAVTVTSLSIPAPVGLRIGSSN